jgi:hypothetical protein
MTRNFIAINDPVHLLLRTLSRRCLLKPACGPDGRPTMHYSVEDSVLPQDYYALALLHGMGGMSLDLVRKACFQLSESDRREIPDQVNCFEAITLDRRCARDLRLKPSAHPRAMCAAELLSFGTGTLRARNDDPAEPFFQFLWAQHGRIHTRQGAVNARIYALHRLTRPGEQDLGKESFESSNVIYGDVYGELEQLWDRRADTAFLEQVAKGLEGLRKSGALATVVHAPLNAAAVHRLHLERQSVWKAPPATARALLRRLEFILDHTTLDRHATTARSLQQPAQQLPNPRSRPVGSDVDDSGYDGWLADEGPRNF